MWRSMMLFCLYVSANALTTATVPSIDVVLAHYDEDISWISKEAAITGYNKARVHVYHKGAAGDAVKKLSDALLPSVPAAKVVSLPNVGRESHTYLSHIVDNYDSLADWTVFSQAGEPSFGYKGHRDGGGHLVSGHSFAEYMHPNDEGSLFMFTGAVHLTRSLQHKDAFSHVLRSDYCIHDAKLTSTPSISDGTCPAREWGWSRWWELGWFKGYLTDKINSQRGELPLDFYTKFAPSTPTTPPPLIHQATTHSSRQRAAAVGVWW